MGFHNCKKLYTLFSILILCLQARAEGTGSIFFLDSPVHPFFRSRSTDVVAQTDSMSLPEVGAAVSVLLGFSPPDSLSADGSSKLNEILLPNPFDRPRAVFMMEVKGTEYILQGLGSTQFGTALSKKVIGSNKGNIQITDVDEVPVVSLDESMGFDTDETEVDTELNYLASWLGGSYVTNGIEQWSGELTVPLASGTFLNLHMSKKADKDFASGILSLIRNVRRAIIMHEDFFGQNPAELITGCFTGIKALEREYGPKDIITIQGMELFLTTLSKLFDSLQAAFKGQIVGVIFFDETPNPESRSMLNLVSMSQPSTRWLEELPNSTDLVTIAEVKLVRETLAWITGIILLISTLLGIYYLLYMPITRDTLLYSNVKLD